MSIRQGNNKLFRKASLVVQLIISIGFAFCAAVILKQMIFLQHSAEIGFSFKNRGIVILRNDGQGNILSNHLKQIPEITEAISADSMHPLLSTGSRISRAVDGWDDKPFDAEDINMEMMFASPEYNSFYDFRIVAGEMLTDLDPDSLVLLNESATKAFGWHDPIGKNFIFNNSAYTVKGVIRNVYNFAPTIEAAPIFYRKPLFTSAPTLVLFKYQEGMWKSGKEKIESLIENLYPDLAFTQIYNTEEEYDKFLKSEKALMKLLTFVSAICMIVCVFGFVSIVSLSCEERRKSIAIRKINGATVADIIAIFAKEYFLLLIIGAAIAFPAGFLVMRRWLAHYVTQTTVPAWIHASIICVSALVIVFCVWWQIYKSSIENPADVLKSE